MKTLILIALLSVSITCNAALSESACAGLVVNNLKTINGTVAEAQAVTYWTQICKGILDHIKAAATVGPLPAGTLKDAENRPLTGDTGTAIGVIQ